MEVSIDETILEHVIERDGDYICRSFLNFLVQRIITVLQKVLELTLFWNQWLSWNWRIEREALVRSSLILSMEDSLIKRCTWVLEKMKKFIVLLIGESCEVVWCPWLFSGLWGTEEDGKWKDTCVKKKWHPCVSFGKIILKKVRSIELVWEEWSLMKVLKW